MNRITAISNYTYVFESAITVTILPLIGPQEIGEIISEINLITDVDKLNLRAKFSNGPAHIFIWIMLKVFNLSTKIAINAIQRLSKREDIGSTGLGYGLAYPHTQVVGIDDVRICIIRCNDISFNFESIDCQPVTLFTFQVTDFLRSREDKRVTVGVSTALRRSAPGYCISDLTNNLESIFGIPPNWQEKIIPITLDR